MLIFGNGKPYAGALVFRSDKATNMSEADVIETIWPEIERLNVESQGHSRLTKNMLVVMPPSKNGLEKSSKGTVLRTQMEKIFAREIENAYTEMNGVGSDQHMNGEDTRPVPDDEVPRAILDIVICVVGDKGPLADDADFFSYGVDSIACMQIRTALQRVRHSHSLGVVDKIETLSNNFQETTPRVG